MDWSLIKLKQVLGGEAKQAILNYYMGQEITLQDLRYVTGDASGGQVGPFGGDKGIRYIYTAKNGWIDLAHFFQVAAGAQSNEIKGWKKDVWIIWPAYTVYLWGKTVKTENSSIFVKQVV